MRIAPINSVNYKNSRKDNLKSFSFGALQMPVKPGDIIELMPRIKMFRTGIASDSFNPKGINFSLGIRPIEGRPASMVLLADTPMESSAEKELNQQLFKGQADSIDNGIIGRIIDPDMTKLFNNALKGI